MASPKFTGKMTVVNFSIAPETATVGALSWSRLGAMRGKSLTGTWDSTDATADTSPGYSKESLTTFFGVEFSGDGVAYGEAVSNQKTLRSHFYGPGVATDYQPKIWLQIIDPDGSSYVGPFMLTEMGDERPHADAATWSVKATSNGAVTYTPA